MFHRHFIKRLCSCSQYRLNKRKELDFEFLLNTKNADYIQACIAKKKSAGDVRTLLEINSKIHSGNITDLERENLLDELEQESLKIPNCIHPSVFEYESPKLVDTVNLKPSFNFEPKSLSEIAQVISGLHHKNMGNITGNGSYAFSGPLALLEEALIQYVVTHLLRRGFTILSVPDMLYSSVIEACGMQVRGQRSQVYSLKNQENLCLSGTAEMAFGGYLKHRRLDHSLLPLRYASVSRCFRAEEAAVKAERGVYRVHAFTKVEMFGITSQETGSESEQLYSEFIDLQRNLFSDLDLHFKVLPLLSSSQSEGTRGEEASRILGPLEEDDPLLLQLLRERYLEGPSSDPYNLELEKDDPKSDYNAYRVAFPSWVRANKNLEKLFGKKCCGFFVEAGALDGEFISNTLRLEKELGWNGLLVEADREMFQEMQKKKRKAWMSHSCLAPNGYPEEIMFTSYKGDSTNSASKNMLIRATGNIDGVVPPAKGLMGTPEDPYPVQCFPLYSYLKALNVSTVDYITLDVEGAEGSILLTFPWEKVNVSVWTVEHRDENRAFAVAEAKEKNPFWTEGSVASGVYGKGGSLRKTVYATKYDPSKGEDEAFIRFMDKKGYSLYDYWDGDYTFIHKASDVCRRHCR